MTDTLTRFEVWAPTHEAPPPRSRLYSLEPIGIGTPEVESLSSYLNRLAQAHCVTVTTLIAHELLPHVGPSAPARAHRAAPPSRGGLRGLGQLLARRLYGLGRTAATWVDGLEAVTGRCDLRFLTLLTWRQILPDRHVFAPVFRWCPVCFDAWVTTGYPLYDPLLWKLKPITTCIRHQRRLRSRCRACQQPLTTFSGRSRPGYCSRCGAWLGTAGGADLEPDERLSEEDWPWQRWVVTTLGELLHVAPRLASPPPTETVARAMTAYKASHTAAGRPSLRDTLGTPRKRVGKWSRGEARIQLDLLLTFCFHAGLSLVQFLTELPSAPPPPAETTSPSMRTPIMPPGYWPPKDTQRAALRRALEAALTREDPPVSLRAAAQREHVAVRTLQAYEPQLCQQIVQRYAAYHTQRRDRLRHGLEQAVHEEPAPTLASVCQRSTVPPSTAWRHFPDLCRQIVARAERDRYQQFAALQRTLEHALTETPPPTLDTVAVRLRRGANGLRQHFPALCRQITARHDAYQHVCFLQRRQAVLEEIRAVALALHAQGIFPSSTRVAAQLARPRNIASNTEDMAVLRHIRRELGWPQ
jgi:hypothetical protein